MMIFFQSCGYCLCVRLDLIFLKPALEPDCASPFFKELHSPTCSPNSLFKPVSPSSLVNPLSLLLPTSDLVTIPLSWLKSSSLDFPSCVKFVFIREREVIFFLSHWTPYILLVFFLMWSFCSLPCIMAFRCSPLTLNCVLLEHKGCLLTRLHSLAYRTLCGQGFSTFCFAGWFCIIARELVGDW